MNVNDNIKVKFKHNRVKKGIKENGESILIPVSTECTVEVAGLALVGSSMCHPNDNFCFDTGRKKALKRALNGAPLNKVQKTLVWESYRNMPVNPRW